MSQGVHDVIEKQVELRAPRSRVWRALVDPAEFGAWFGVKLDRPFAPGASIQGDFSEDLPPQEVFDAEAKRLGFEPAPVKAPPANAVFCTVERMEPESYLSFRWIPYGIDATVDLENEPTTLVEFQLEARGDATVLTIRESGFENVPAHRRARAFRMNEGGWEAQAENVKRFVEGDHGEGA